MCGIHHITSGVTADLFRPRICSGRNKFASGYVPESADLFRLNKFASGYITRICSDMPDSLVM